MSALSDKMRRVRERPVSCRVGGVDRAFTIRIPNDGEFEDFRHWLAGRPWTPRRLVQRCVVAWDVQEIDLIPGGSPVAVEFDDAALAALLDDDSDLVGALFVEITTGIEARNAKKADALKNSPPGLSE